MKYLRLDLYVNEKEYCIGEADATQAGFERIMWMHDIIDGRIAQELRDTGASSISDSQITEEILDMLNEMYDFEVSDNHDIVFCMCLWERDAETDECEHLYSTYTLAKVQELED